MFDAHADGEVRAFSLNVLVVAVLWLSGCLAHQGPATLTPVQVPPGMKVALREVDVRALAKGEYDEVERALAEAPPEWTSRRRWTWRRHRAGRAR